VALRGLGCALSCDRRLDLGARLRTAEMRHDIGIAAQSGERSDIAVAPRAQRQPLGLDHLPSSLAACAA
jgi:hypothetical protein